MRPEMTKNAITQISLWNDLDSLIVVIDGLRPIANNSEEEWRRETIRVVETSPVSNLELIVYDKNIGITDHVNRVQRLLLPKHPRAIWVEEDFQLNFAEYAKFTKDLDIPNQPFLSCANGQADHKEIDLPLRTLFPPFWGQVVNMELTEEIERIRKDKKIDTKVAHEILSIFHSNFTFPKNYLIKKQITYWNNYFRWAVDNPNRWDALATYVLWKHGSPTLVSPQNLVNDLANLDTRGMNKRHEEQVVIQHEPRLQTLTNISICILCEKRKSRSAFSAHELIKNNFQYRRRIMLGK